jgi:hypothetical protein
MGDGDVTDYASCTPKPKVVFRKSMVIDAENSRSWRRNKDLQVNYNPQQAAAIDGGDLCRPHRLPAWASGGGRL